MANRIQRPSIIQRGLVSLAIDNDQSPLSVAVGREVRYIGDVPAAMDRPGRPAGSWRLLHCATSIVEEERKGVQDMDGRDCVY